MKEFLNYVLLDWGTIEIKVKTLLVIFIFNVFVWVLLLIIKKSLYRISKIDAAKKYSIYSLLRYLIISLAIVASLQIIGFDLSILLAGSAALLVGLGLGIQYLFSDYISGIILLLDSTIKVGDVIEINNLICRVEEIHLRTTKVKTREDKYIVLPNTDLTRNHLINWTLNEVISRFEVVIGVDYSSDVSLVMKLIKQAALDHPDVAKKPVPFVRFEDYADSSLIFSLHFWAEEVFRVENLKSDLRVVIYEAFRQNGVTIPFPQRVVHIKNKT